VPFLQTGNEVNCAGLELRPCGGYVTRRSRRSSGYDSLLGNKPEGLEGSRPGRRVISAVSAA